MMHVEEQGEHDAADDADDERVVEVAVEAVAEEQAELRDADDRWPTLTMLTLLTAATRSPAEMTGTASGSSTAKNRLPRV